MARNLGAQPGLAAELVLVVSELATNLLRHAGGGTLTLETQGEGGGRMGMRIESRDTGPGLEDVERALSEGFSTAGGLGQGLPMVKRLTDSMEIVTSSQGTTIVGVKWIQARNPSA